MILLTNILISVAVFGLGVGAILGASLAVQHKVERHIVQYIV